MIGKYDDISYRIADAFQVRQCKASSADPATSPFNGLTSQAWGANPATTLATDRPITLVSWYEHSDVNLHLGLVDTIPNSGERPLLAEKTSSGSFASPNNTNFNVTHGGFEAGHVRHWESWSLRNFVTPTNNWVASHFPLRPASNFKAANSNSVNSKGTNDASSSTKFILYEGRFAIFSTNANGYLYEWQSGIGPWLCLDRVLDDAELYSLARNPWPYLRRYWSDVLFLVNAVTGEDFGPRRWDFEATYNDTTSRSPAGYVPFLDYSSRSVRGLGHRLYYPVPPPPIIPGEAVPNRLTLLGVGK